MNPKPDSQVGREATVAPGGTVIVPGIAAIPGTTSLKDRDHDHILPGLPSILIHWYSLCPIEIIELRLSCRLYPGTYGTNCRN